jgi:hypothetical protein
MFASPTNRHNEHNQIKIYFDVWSIAMDTAHTVYTVGKFKIDRSFRRFGSFAIVATDLVLVALDSLGLQLSVYEISQL